MTAPLRVLLLEDRPDDAELAVIALEEGGLVVEASRVDSREGFLAALSPELDVILADYSLPGFGADEALVTLQASGLTVPMIIVSGTISEETAVACLHAGAADYLVKDRLARLPQAVRGAVERRRLIDEQQAYVERLRVTAAELADANEALLAADRQKDRFMTMTAHELRTPLTSILGFTELLVAEPEAAGTPQGARWIEVVHRQAKRLVAQIEDLLTLVRLETGEFEARPGPVRVQEAVCGVLRRLGMEGMVAVECPGALTIEVDPLCLEGIVASFVSNAVKYGAEPLVLRVGQTEQEVWLRVCDAGPGVPAAFVSRLFDKYSRSESVDWAGGLGLGLALASRLARAAGGRVWFEPNQPHGACFSVAFPVAVSVGV